MDRMPIRRAEQNGSNPKDTEREEKVEFRNLKIILNVPNFNLPHSNFCLLSVFSLLNTMTCLYLPLVSWSLRG